MWNLWKSVCRAVVSPVTWLIAWFERLDPQDPVERALRRYVTRACSLGAVAIVLFVSAAIVGVPHIQLGEFRYNGEKEVSGWVRGENKMEAWYVSVTGWQQVEREEYGQEGCPLLLFIPLRECW